MEGVLDLSVTIGTYSRCCMLQQIFMVKMNLSYNSIIDRPLFHEINIVINNKYLNLKSLINKRVTTMRRRQLISRRCNSSFLNEKNTLILGHKKPIKEKLEIRIEIVKELKEVSLFSKENAFTKIGSTLDPK